MKVCLAVSEERGLESRLARNFGGAPGLLIVDSENESVEWIDAAAGACRSAPIEIDLIICGGIGRALLGQMRQQGIPVFGTGLPTAGEALAAWKAGELEEIQSAACGAGNCGCAGKNKGNPYCGGAEKSGCGC